MIQTQKTALPASEGVNCRILLNTRPTGALTAENFKLDERDIVLPLTGQILAQTLYLSLDPYMRGRMSGAPSYAASVAPGDVMIGGTVSCVVAWGTRTTRKAISYSGSVAGSNMNCSTAKD